MRGFFHPRNGERERRRSRLRGAVAVVSWGGLRDCLGGLKCFFQMSPKDHFCCVVWDFDFAGAVDKLRVNKGRI